MTPKITYKERAGKLLIRIIIHDQSSGLYDTGISINPEQFSEDKQICGDPSIQSWMTSTHSALLNLFRPGMTSKSLWLNLINSLSGSDATIRMALEYYITNMPLRDSTKAVYVSLGNSMMRGNIYETQLADISPALLRQFFKGLNCIDTTKYGMLDKIKAVINRYIRDHRLKYEVDFHDIVKRPKYTAKDAEWLTEEEVQLLRETEFTKNNEPESRDVFCLCCYTGMSMSDGLKFSLDNIKSINGRDYVVYSRTKTGSLCKVPIIKQAREIIDSRTWPVSIAKRTYQTKVMKFSKILNRKVHTHLARHTFGCMFLYLGFSIETVSKLMGHPDIRITQRIYAKVSQEKIERELAEIGI